MQGMPVQLPESFSQNPVGAEIGLWPLAWGWWVAIAISLTFLVLFILWFRHYRKKRLMLRQAIKALNTLEMDDKDYFARCNHILKRAFLSYFPEKAVASLYGKQWQNFLSQSLSAGQKQNLAPLIEQLGSSMYLPNTENSASEETQKQTIKLLKAVLPPGKKQLQALEETIR